MSCEMRQITKEEYEAGHAVCDCGEFTHIFRQLAMHRLQKGYSGEMCKRCSMWMCRLDKIELHSAPIQQADDIKSARGGVT